ncbi:MAG: YdcF family protein [Bacteroidota bacterium]
MKPFIHNVIAHILKIVFLAFITASFSNCNAYYNAFYTDPVKCFEIAYQKKPYDVIIVPGFPYDSGRVNMVLSERVKWAHYLYKKGYAKNIIFSGGAVHSPYIEANVMKLLAIQTGIEADHIFIETKAEHTTENLYYSTMMAKELGFKSIAFASEAAQCSFMKPFKRKFKLTVDFIPVIVDSIIHLPIRFKPIDDSLVFVKGFVSLEKRESKLKSLRGTRGHKVKVEMRRAKKLRLKSTHPYDNK